MDYSHISDTETQPDKKGDDQSTVGLIGGQPKDDDSGLDVSKYTGPHSKASGEIEDTQAPFKTGPGNGLHSQNNEGLDVPDTKRPL